jgi:hypothetical protein
LPPHKLHPDLNVRPRSLKKQRTSLILRLSVSDYDGGEGIVVAANSGPVTVTGRPVKYGDDPRFTIMCPRSPPRS